MSSKLRFLILAAAVECTLAPTSSHSWCQSSTTEPATLPAPTTNSATSDEYFRLWGYSLASDLQVANVDLTDAERARFQKGFSDSLQHLPPPCEYRKAASDVENLIHVRRKKLTESIAAQNRQQAEAFSADLKKQPDIKQLANGVCYQIIKPGDGATPAAKQTVSVHYTGRLIDGTPFLEMGPIDNVLIPQHEVCPGWIETLQTIHPGGTVVVYVPPPLSETQAESFGITKDAGRVYQIDLLGVRDTTAEEMETATIPPAPDPVPPPPSGYDQAALVEQWGWMVGRRTDAGLLAQTDSEKANLIEGLMAGVRGEPGATTSPAISADTDAFISQRREIVLHILEKRQLDENVAFFEKLKENPNVVAADGMYYQILQPGSGEYPKMNQTVKVLYTGKLINGSVFDSSSVGPMDVALDSVIPGWKLGMQHINAGGKIRLYIPPELAYGKDAGGGIPSNSILVFDVELISINRVPTSKP